jgi:hypothetical protein
MTGAGEGHSTAETATADQACGTDPRPFGGRVGRSISGGNSGGRRRDGRGAWRGGHAGRPPTARPADMDAPEPTGGVAVARPGTVAAAPSHARSCRVAWETIWSMSPMATVSSATPGQWRSGCAGSSSGLPRAACPAKALRGRSRQAPRRPRRATHLGPDAPDDEGSRRRAEVKPRGGVPQSYRPPRHLPTSGAVRRPAATGIARPPSTRPPRTLPTVRRSPSYGQ